MKSISARKSQKEATAKRRERVIALTKIARNLVMMGKSSGDHSGRAPFSICVMSDQTRVDDPETLLSILPRGSAFIFRDYAHPERLAVAKTLRTRAAQHGVLFLVAGDFALASRVHADGLHVPGWMLAKPGLWQSFKGIRTVACHSLGDLQKAALFGADLALLSPVFATRSHQGAPHLGRAGFLAMTRQAGLPVLALGGINHENASRLGGANVSGIAAISAFS